MTTRERIPSIARRAGTNWIMIDHLAPGTDAASTWAWIPAFLIPTRFVQTAVRVDITLGAAGRWTADESNNTRTDCLAVDLSAHTVRSAR